MKLLNCPICNSSNKVEIIKYQESQGQITGVWFCHSCCHAWRTAPWRLSGKHEHFSKASYTKIENSKRLDATKSNIFRDIIKWAETLNTKSKLMVDFGCSYGTLLEMFNDAGWNTLGIEISDASQKVLAEKGLRWSSDIDRSGLQQKSVDLIIMSDVIYYFENPINELNIIKKYLKHDGWIYLRQPTRAGLLRVFYYLNKKRFLNKYLWGDHVHIFSKRSTNLLLHKAGFQKVVFLKENNFKRTFKHQLLHKTLKFLDIITLGFLDLTPSFIIKASN